MTLPPEPEQPCLNALVLDPPKEDSSSGLFGSVSELMGLSEAMGSAGWEGAVPSGSGGAWNTDSAIMGAFSLGVTSRTKFLGSSLSAAFTQIIEVGPPPVLKTSRKSGMPMRNH